MLHKKHVAPILKAVGDQTSNNLARAQAYITRTQKDDDWSFVIKMQALVEAALTDAVISRIGDGTLKKLVERLPIADAQIGKLAFAKEMGLLEKDQLAFVRRMAELRNRLAHRIEDIDFTFQEHLATFKAEQLKTWKVTIAFFAEGLVESTRWQEVAEKQPRFAIAMAVIVLIGSLEISKSKDVTSRMLQDAMTVTAADLLRQIRGEPDEPPAVAG